MIVVTTIKQTCASHPSQWEGRTSDDRAIYIRYRYGWLSVRLSQPGGTTADAVRADEIHSEQLGDKYDGLLLFDRLQTLLAGFVDFGKAVAA